MKIRQILVLIFLVQLSLIVSNKSRTKQKSKQKSKDQTQFDKKERYKVEMGESATETSQLANLLKQVLNSKDEKDIQLPESEEGLQQLQSLLTKIPQIISSKDQELTSAASSDQLPADENQQIQQLLSLLKTYDNTQEQQQEQQQQTEKVKESEDKPVESLRLKKEKPVDIKANGNTGGSKFEKYWQIQIPKDYLDEQEKNNTAANEAFKTSSEGRDEAEGVSYEGELEMKINRKDVSGKLQIEGLQSLYVRINDHSIYAASNKSSGYRGIISQLDFKDIISSADNTNQGMCCQNVYFVDEVQLKGIEYNCFQIETKDTQWELCAPDRGFIDMWRNNLNGFIILWDLKRKGIYDAKQFSKLQDDICEKPIGYNYVNQEQWPCTCPEGQSQSPINLVKDDAIKMPVARTLWKYLQGVNLNSIQYFRETAIQGYFGEFVFIDDKMEKKKYSAQELRFKFPSEHSINGKFFDGEMQIFHKNQEQERMVLSIMLSISASGTKKFDGFLNRLKVLALEDRKKHKVWFKGCLNAKPNLIDLLGKKNQKGEFEDMLGQSFFTYMGSDTLPPCYESVRWIVYEKPVYISQIYFDDLKTKVLGDKTKNNQRSQMPLMDREVKYYESKECPIVASIPNSYQYVTVDGQRDFYGIVQDKQQMGFDSEIDFKKKQLNLKMLSKKDVIPPHIFNNLLKKFRVYQSGVPEDYDFYGPDSTYQEDYDQLVGNMMKAQADRDLQQAAIKQSSK